MYYHATGYPAGVPPMWRWRRSIHWLRPRQRKTIHWPSSLMSANRRLPPKRTWRPWKKRGQATAFSAKHPLTGADLPVWVANFVLMEYGSGAVMSVPGHDQRDWEFARKYGIADCAGDRTGTTMQNATSTKQRSLTIRRLINSGEFDGLSSAQAFDAIADALAATRCRPPYDQLPAARLGRFPPALLGLSDSNDPLRGLRRGAGAGTGSAGRVLPTNVQFEGVRSPLTTMESFLKVACPNCGSRCPQGNRHLRHLHGIVLVLRALRQPRRQQADGGRPGQLLGAGGSLCGRYRARHSAPALRTLLHSSSCAMKGWWRTTNLHPNC